MIYEIVKTVIFGAASQFLATPGVTALLTVTLVTSLYTVDFRDLVLVATICQVSIKVQMVKMHMNCEKKGMWEKWM